MTCFTWPRPRSFQRIGGGHYTMHVGSQWSFLWYWTSIAQPSRSGYGYGNCVCYPYF